MGQWSFSELRHDDVRRGSHDEGMFKTEHVQDGEYAGTDSLIREILQNAIDARVGNEAVKVRISVRDSKESPTADRLSHYFARLGPALEVKQVSCDHRGIPHLEPRFLVVEDFRTRGLEGNVSLFKDPPLATSAKESFYWFWRNIGRSGKTGDDLGRWGYGKTVFRAASQIGCMFGLTVRASDGQRLLMGQAVLQIHEFNSREHKPEGYWCGKKDSQGLPLPVNDKTELDQFCREWHVTRSSEPGLSVIIPFIPPEINATGLAQAVAAHFFIRIVRGELEVEILDSIHGVIKLDYANIAEVCKQIEWNGPARTKRHRAPPIEFAKRCLSDSELYRTPVLGEDRIPTWDHSLLPANDLVRLRKHFELGALVGVCVRLSLPRKDGSTLTGEVIAWLQDTREGKPVDSYFIREGMTITKLNSAAGKRGIQALVLVEPGPMAELLGDTEGPSHEDWDTSEDRPDRNWKTWKGRVRFIRKIVDGLTDLLTTPLNEPDFDRLVDFFSLDQVAIGASPTVAGPIRTSPSPINITPREKSRWYRVSEHTGGFAISRDAQYPLPQEAGLRLSLAYDIPSGNPLRNWSKFDFDISSTNSLPRVSGHGLKAKVIKGNVLHLTQFENDFAFSMEGFDHFRDLFIKVDELSIPENT